MNSPVETQAWDSAGAWNPTNLSELTSRLIDHSRIPIPVDTRLRIGAACGLGLVAVLTSVVGLGRDLSSVSRPGIFLFGWPFVRWLLWDGLHASVAFVVGLIVLVIALPALVISRGFSRIRPAALLPLFLLVPLGSFAGIPLLIAVFVVLLNLATWAALGVLIVVLSILAVVLVVFALFSAR